MIEITRPLARHIVQSRYADLPPDVRHEGVRAFHNALGCMLGGSQEVIVQQATAALAKFSGPPQATVIGTGRRLDAPTAAQLNTMSNFVLSYNDTHLATVAHPGGAPTAALLALAETRDASGEEVLHALILGIEVACRLANVIAAPPAACHVGLSTHGVTNVIGTAVAAGKLMGFNEDQMVWAIGLAVTQAAGLRSAHGSAASKLIGGIAARGGLMSAYLAQEGFSCSEQPIEGPKGFADVFGQPAHLPHALDRLGEHYEMKNNAYKPFPCGIVQQAAVDTCLKLAIEHRLDASAVERVELQVHPLTVKLTNRPQPKDALQALVSAQHWCAVALLFRRAGLQEGRNERVRDPVVAAMRERITLSADPSLSSVAAAATVILKDGRRISHRIEHCMGSLERPMTDAELDEKFRSQARLILPEKQVDALISQCWKLPELDKVGRLATQFFQAS